MHDFRLVSQAGGGSWRLYFEYANDSRSKIGLARSESMSGPWEVPDPLFEARPSAWNSWHLSTCPIVNSDLENPAMFCNGAMRDAHWRIGWVIFNADYTRMVRRSAQPLGLPHGARRGEDTDIAFAPLGMDDGKIHLYCSVSDQYCIRAIIGRA